MKLVITPDADGDALSIIDENFPPENFIIINAENYDYLLRSYSAEDLLVMLVSFNTPEK